MLLSFSKIFGYLAVCCNLGLFLSKDRRVICIVKGIIEIFWALSYFLIERYTIAILALTATIRQCVFFFRGRRAWADKRVWLYLFLVVTLLSPITEIIIAVGKSLAFYQIAITFLPMVASVFYVFAYYCKSALNTKFIALPGVVIYLIYVSIIQNQAGIVGNILSLLSLSMGLINEYVNYKK
jgi:hypothetical protein